MRFYTPSDYATKAMDMLWDSAKSFNGCLYGLEALGALRVEKRPCYGGGAGWTRYN